MFDDNDKEIRNGVPCCRENCIHYDPAEDNACSGLLDGKPMAEKCSEYFPAEGRKCMDCGEFIPKGWLHGCYDRAKA